MVTFSARGRKALLMIGGLYGLMTAAAAALFPEATSGWIPPFPRVFQCGVSVVALFAGCLPPAFLFLGASQQPAISLLSKISFATAPLKLVHMIESIDAGAVIHEAIGEYDYRVRDDWQNAVRMVSEIAPIILLDLRVLSKSVIDEILHISSSRMQKKTFYIVEERIIIPELRAVLTFPGVWSHLLTPQQMVNVLGGIGCGFLFVRGIGLQRYLENRVHASNMASRL